MILRPRVQCSYGGAPAWDRWSSLWRRRGCAPAASGACRWVPVRSPARFPRLDARFVNGLQAGIDGLDKSGFLKADIRRNPHHSSFRDPVHHPDIFGKAASAGAEAAGHPHLLVSRALREKFLLAIETLAAGNVMESQHAVTRTPLANPVAHRLNRSGNFVSENLRRRQEAVLDLLDVRSADAAGPDAHQHFTGGNLRHRNFLRRHAALAAIDSSPHALFCG